MDFLVYDNIYTYHKRMPSIHHYPDSNLLVKQIAITNNGAFWFETDFNKEETNVSVNSPYLHLHKGIQSITKMQFDKEPWFIDMKSPVYNPKTKCIEIKKPGAWPWSKPVFKKLVRNNYYGTEIPKRKMKTLGNWFFDYHNKRISIILNYYPGHRNLNYLSMGEA